MKLAILLETLRTDVLELQQRLIDELDDEFDVSLKDGSRVAAGRDAYSIQVRHPLLKQPVTISVLADGPKGPEVKVGSFMQFDLSHPRGLEGLIEYVNARVDYVKIHKWLLDNRFVEMDKSTFEGQSGVRLFGSGFIKSSKLFVRRTRTPDWTDTDMTLAFKLGFDSYQNVQHEWWQIDKDTVYSTTSHRIHTFAQVESLLGSIIKHAPK